MIARFSLSRVAALSAVVVFPSLALGLSAPREGERFAEPVGPAGAEKPQPVRPLLRFKLMNSSKKKVTAAKIKRAFNVNGMGGATFIDLPVFDADPQICEVTPNQDTASVKLFLTVDVDGKGMLKTFISSWWQYPRQEGGDWLHWVDATCLEIVAPSGTEPYKARMTVSVTRCIPNQPADEPDEANVLTFTEDALPPP